MDFYVMYEQAHPPHLHTARIGFLHPTLDAGRPALLPLYAWYRCLILMYNMDPAFQCVSYLVGFSVRQ